MKNKIVLILVTICFISINNLFSQVWAPDGTEWYNHYMETGVAQPATYGYHYMKVEGDTLVNGIMCKHISRYIINPDGQYYAVSLPIITYASDNIIYYLQNNQFYILYNFSAEIGDSWTSRNPYEFFGWPSLEGEDTLTTYTVDSVRFVTVNGKDLKQIYVNSSSYWKFGAFISEQIGCLRFMLPGLWGSWDPPVIRSLRCYFDDSISYTYFTPCDSLITVSGIGEEVNMLNDIKVFPNPTNNKVTFAMENTEHHKNITLKCFNLLGKQVFETTILSGQKEIGTVVSNWSQGMYVAVVYSNGLAAGQCKFAVR